MTVISAMRFNKKEGAIVADEQSSNFNSNRKYDIANKLHQVSTKDCIVLYGGSGSAGLAYEASLAIPQVVSNTSSTSPTDISNIISHVLNQTQFKWLDGVLASTHQLTLEDFKRGFYIDSNENKCEIPLERMKFLGEFISKMRNDFSTGFLNLGYSDDEGITLSISTTNEITPNLIPSPYVSIGSGADKADDALYTFVEEISRDKRDKIDRLDGIAQLLHATYRASKMNVGVGGVPVLSVLQGNEIYNPNEAESRLAAEIVRARNEGFISKKFLRKSLDGLVYQSASFEEVNKDFLENVRNPDKLVLMLRGYKV